MLQEAYAEAKGLLSQNLDALHKIAAFLIQKETITGKEFMAIYHEVLKEREGGQEIEAEDIAAKAMTETAEAKATEESVKEDPEAEKAFEDDGSGVVEV